MKSIITLAVVSLILAGCSHDDSSDPTSPAAPVGNTTSPSNNTVNLPPDYSKISCETIPECSNACDVAFPAVTESFIRQSICTVEAGISDPNSTPCNALVQLNQSAYLANNSFCKNKKVTEIINLKSIGSTECSANSDCAKYCSQLYIPTTDQAIERAAAASGGGVGGGAVLSALLANDVVKSALAACLAAPVNYVFPFLP